MIVLSLNYHGLASLHKKLVLCRLVEEQHPDVLFLHESMCDGKSIVAKLELLIKGWKFVCVDAKGKSSSLLLGWKVIFFHFLNA